MNNKINQHEKEESDAPIFGSWKKLYALVFLSLILLIFLFYLFTKAFE